MGARRIDSGRAEGLWKWRGTGALIASGCLWVSLAALAAAAQVLPAPSGRRVMTPVFEPPYRVTIRVYAASGRGVPTPDQGVSLCLTDASGRKIGMDPSTGAPVAAIPNAVYAPVVNPQPMAPVGPRGRAGNGIALDDPQDGRYLLEVVGAATVRYELAVEVWDRAGRRRWLDFTQGMTERGAVDRYALTYASAETPPVSLAEQRDLSALTVRLHGAPPDGSQELVSELLLTDPRGRRLGFDGGARALLRGIPRGYYEEDASVSPMRELYVPAPVEGTYRLEVIGTREGRYDLEIRAYGDEAEPGGAAGVDGIPTTPGTVHRYALEYTRTGGAALSLAGSLKDGGPLLSYANPVGTRTELPPRRSTVTLVIFYAAGIEPASFQVALDGQDLTARFAPRPDGHEAVTLTLPRGTSTLVLSVDGTDEGGLPSSQKDRLVFVRR